MWFVIGCICGEFAGRWLTHAVYVVIIAAILLGKRFCGA